MKLVVDVHYTNTTALCAGILFNHWNTSDISQKLLTHTENIQAYESGSFYKRELPCIMNLIKQHNITPELIIIDGYVFLDGESEAGLGKYLYDSLKGNTPIIGVAKKAFNQIAPDYEILRGISTKPLYITAIDIPLAEAKEKIATMHGEHRIPTLLRQVDQLCRGIEF
ncbi:MAG TPA: endonuclease V [Leucothrix mucor]|uniref:Endonuclease V n=1 Tax=Leucothrix mucor TaxID=45248 RepID=A0A7V2T526_LEUMU|nr:endonuclease V [Leucothrix mucor]